MKQPMPALEAMKEQMTVTEGGSSEGIQEINFIPSNETLASFFSLCFSAATGEPERQKGTEYE